MSEPFDKIDGRELIFMLRGMPEKCDYCDEKDPNELNPLSGGEWACNACLDSWGFFDPQPPQES